MAETTVRTGHVVGSNCWSYAAKEGQFPAGTLRTVWLAGGMDTEPFGVRCTEVQFSELSRLPFASRVELACEMKAKNNKIVYSVFAILGVDRADGRAEESGLLDSLSE